jgi:Flp pilus assembly protein TadG
LRALRDRSGAQAVEFALLAPMLLTTIIGGIEFSRFIWTQSALHLSVEEAARCYAVALCTSSTAQTYAAAVTPQLNFSSSVFTASQPITGTCAGEYQVSASYTFVFIPGGVFPLTPTLSAVACVP